MGKTTNARSGAALTVALVLCTGLFATLTTGCSRDREGSTDTTAVASTGSAPADAGTNPDTAAGGGVAPDTAASGAAPASGGASASAGSASGGPATSVDHSSPTPSVVSTTRLAGAPADGARTTLAGPTATMVPPTGPVATAAGRGATTTVASASPTAAPTAAPTSAAPTTRSISVPRRPLGGGRPSATTTTTVPSTPATRMRPGALHPATVAPTSAAPTTRGVVPTLRIPTVPTRPVLRVVTTTSTPRG